MRAGKEQRSPMLGYLAADDRDRPRWRLIVYFVSSYAVAYAAHMMLFDRWDRVLIPAALPWAIAAGVAIWHYRRHLPLRPAWFTLAIASMIFVLPHLLLS